MASAGLPVWAAAAAAQRLPTALLSGLHLYSSAARLAARHAAIKSGPQQTAFMQDDASGTHSVRNFIARHPTFEQAVKFCPGMGRFYLFSVDLSTSSPFGGETIHLYPSFRETPCLADERACAPDGTHFVARFTDHSQEASLVRLYEISSAAYVEVAAEFWPHDITWAPDSSMFALWALAAWKVYVVSKVKLGCELTGSSSGVRLPIACAWSPCSRHFAIARSAQLIISQPQERLVLT